MDSAPGSPHARVAVIGGSGLYALPGDASPLRVDTPYGSTSSELAVGSFGGTTVAFLARHGVSHSVPPARVNHRANLWALARVGVRAVFASAAVGSLDATLRPGEFAVPDQLLDRTGRRDDTYFDGDDVQHLTFADPFCPGVRRALLTGVSAAGERARPTATTAVIRGPRFSTRAESRALRAAGADIVNMTQYPESALAAELGVGYASLSFVTDMDAGVGAGVGDDAAVTAAVVLERLAAARPRIVRILDAAIRALPADYEPRPGVDPEAVARVLAMPPVAAP